MPLTESLPSSLNNTMAQDLILVYLPFLLHCITLKCCDMISLLEILPNVTMWCHKSSLISLVFRHFFALLVVHPFRQTLESCRCFLKTLRLLVISLNLDINVERTDLFKVSTPLIQNKINSFAFIFKSFTFFFYQKIYHCLHKAPERFLSILLSFAIVKYTYFAIVSSNWVIPKAHFLG